MHMYKNVWCSGRDDLLKAGYVYLHFFTMGEGNLSLLGSAWCHEHHHNHVIYMWPSLLSNLWVAGQLVDSDGIFNLNVVWESSIKFLHHNTHWALHEVMWLSCACHVGIAYAGICLSHPQTPPSARGRVWWHCWLCWLSIHVTCSSHCSVSSWFYA